MKCLKGCLSNHLTLFELGLWQEPIGRLISVAALSVFIFATACDRAAANQDQILGRVHCTAFSIKPKRNPPFDYSIMFTVDAGKLSASRTTSKRPGKTLFFGSVSPTGSIHVVGRGAHQTGDAWRFDFYGKIKRLGDTVLNGRLTMVTGRGTRRCTMSFLETPNQLRAKLGVGPAEHHKAAVVEPGSSHMPSIVSQPPISKPPERTKEQPVAHAPLQTAASPNVQDLTRATNDLNEQIRLLQTLVKELHDERSRNESPAALIDLSIKAVEEKADELEKQRSAQPTINSSKYRTPIRPNNGQAFPTARSVSETYPPIPYYISGTLETGDFWVLPEISDQGQLQFKIRFIDFNSPTDKIRSEVAMSAIETEQMADSLRKLWDWSEIAHKNRIRKEFEKRIICFPATNCPKEGQRVDGESSTELVFHVNDEGYTNGVIRRNKGRYVENYDFSIESGLMLRAYMMHVINEAKLEYQAGTQTKSDLDKLFK